MERENLDEGAEIGPDSELHEGDSDREIGADNRAELDTNCSCHLKPLRIAVCPVKQLSGERPCLLVELLN